MTIQSSVAWIDFAEQDRRKMIEVVSLFRVRDTRDELGLGSIRDTFADLFFPGTSTLQTQARYFLFVPWLYLDRERRRAPSSKIADRIKHDEIKLIRALQAAGDTDGVIGRVSGASLQRFPSSIYWNGLGRWGIRRFPGSQGQYHRWLDSFYARQGHYSRPEDKASSVEGVDTNWDPNLPSSPDGFPEQVTLRLTSEDARYLRERLLIACRDSLLATLVGDCRPVEDVDFVWGHPQLAMFPSQQQEWIDHARNFSQAMYGAVLLYNLMLADLRGDAELVTEYQERFSAWWKEWKARILRLPAWDRGDFWKLVRGAGRIPIRTQRFVDAWLDRLFSAGPHSDVSRDSDARRLIREREIWLKRGRSRFQSRQHLELWSGSAGLAPLDYRWPIARRITNDILWGLAG